jgi:hypothetical protein
MTEQEYLRALKAMIDLGHCCLSARQVKLLQLERICTDIERARQLVEDTEEFQEEEEEDDDVRIRRRQRGESF